MGRGDLVMQNHLVVSFLSHLYVIQVPTQLYFEELEKLQQDKAYVRKEAANFETVVLHPGVNRISEKIFFRLNKSRVFKELVTNRSLHVDDLAAEDAYNQKQNPNYKKSKEFLDLKKEAELEAKNREQEETIKNLKEEQEVIKKQLQEFFELKETLNKRKRRDHADDDKDSVS